MAETPVPQTPDRHAAQAGAGDGGDHPIKKTFPSFDSVQWDIHPPVKAARVTEADNLAAETKKIADTSRAINDLAKQPVVHQVEINAKRKELGTLLTNAVSDADELQRLHGPQIQKRLDAVEADIAVKGKGLSRDQLNQLLKNPDVPADKHELYNLLQEEYTLKAAQIARSEMRLLYASEASKGHTDPTAPLPDHGPITTFTPSAKEVRLARDLAGEGNRLSDEGRRTDKIAIVSGQVDTQYSQLHTQGSQDEIAKHASVVESNLRQAKPFIDKDPDKAAHFYQAANAEADQINYSQIKKELADNSTSADRRQELESTLSRSKDARLNYAQLLVKQGKPNDASVYLAKAVADGTQIDNPSDPTYQSFKTIRDAANAPPADFDLIKQEKALTLNLGTEVNDPKKAAELIPKVLPTLIKETADMTAAQQDMQKELQAASNKLKSGGLDAADTTRVQTEIKQLQEQQTSLTANLAQRKQELANTQYKAAILALASQDTKTAAAMLNAAKQNDPNLFDYIKSQGGKGEETFNQLMDKTKEKSFWQQHWHAITEAGIWIGGAAVVGLAVAFAPVTIVGLAVVGVVAASSTAMYVAKNSAGEKATWRDAVDGGFNGLLASSAAAGPLLGLAAKSIPLVARTGEFLSGLAPAVITKLVAASPEWLKVAPKVTAYGKTAISTVTDFARPLYESGSALYSKAPAGLRATAEFLMPSRTAWGVGGIYGGYKFHDDVKNGESVGEAALHFVPHAIEGAFATHAFTKSSRLIGSAFEGTGVAMKAQGPVLESLGQNISRDSESVFGRLFGQTVSSTGRVVSRLSPVAGNAGELATRMSTSLPANLIPKTKLAFGIGVPVAAYMAGRDINSGESYGQALFDAPFNLLKGAQIGQLGSSFSKENVLLKSVAATTGKNTALTYGYTAAKHATLYEMGKENGREATGNFLQEAPVNNATLNAYDLFLNAGVKKVGGRLIKAGIQESTPTLDNIRKFAGVGPAASFMTTGLMTTTEVAGNYYNDKGGRINWLNGWINFRPSNNPNVPLDPNLPNEERLIEERMGSFPELDRPRPYGQQQDDQ
jgi:hypothetical protein